LTLKYKLPKRTDNVVNPTAILVAKAYDPVGGVCLKYKTNRAVEVGRLILGFQELGQVMQNVPPTLKRKVSGEEDIRGEAVMRGESTPMQIETELMNPSQAGEVTKGTASTGGGKKKKKKTKR